MTSEQFAELEQGDRVIFGWHTARHGTIWAKCDYRVLVRFDKYEPEWVHIEDSALLAKEP